MNENKKTHTRNTSDSSFFAKMIPSKKENFKSIPISTVLTRPSHLPPKSKEEELKHRKEIELMNKLYEKTMKEEEKKKEGEEKKRLEREKEIICNMNKWKNIILPDWENKKQSSLFRELIWKGIPPTLRGKAWPLLVGNQLKLTKELYQIHCKRAQETSEKKQMEKKEGEINHEDTVNLIPVDIGRTFPQLGFFQEGGPSHDQLKFVLQAYVCFRPDIGYVQGMSFIAAHLLLQMTPEKSFICMANMLSQNIFNAFFTFNMVKIRKYCLIYEDLIRSYLPDVHKQFEELQVKSDMYLIDWVMTIFTKSLPLEIVGRIWDIYLFDGDIVIFRVALTVLAYRKEFLASGEFGEILKYLNRPSSFQLDENTFFEILQNYRFSPVYLREAYSKHNLNN
eukprot:TRINITY_DN1043_c1_g1_i1.p1 TRINITY_DN1043_c1_g1~~TRINITY_DN1043_c1_g1_i1.p1  ORF type:complete len:394 (-),score=122.33 TRINITY_DN1043_c1_g1_i1:99-1280(-)